MTLSEIEARTAELSQRIRRRRATLKRRVWSKRTCPQCDATKSVLEFEPRKKICCVCANAPRCDECHKRKPRGEYDGRSKTCRQCTAELETPRRRSA